ncbi:MAG TPA: malto-oligosyltrehalose trehalohydrolase, partial [Firmicutes bacterium]|nr:malto-oligosyltrehalose trehalohydrolase [Bacillota bacterium]
MGASILDRARERIGFSVYAKGRQAVSLLLAAGGEVREIPMERSGSVYRCEVEGMGLQPHYKFLLKGPGGGAFPDPCSHYQPEGVHGFSRVVDHEAYRWADGGWAGPQWERALIYELHIGTF